jgi:hypothetical protein
MPLLLQDQQVQLKQLLQLKKKRKRKLKKSIWEIFSEETMMVIEKVLEADTPFIFSKTIKCHVN